MKKTFLFMAALGIILTSCAPKVQTVTPTALETPLTPVTLTKEQIKAVKEGVTSSLKDPDSARFGTMVAGHGEKNAIYVCGYVNAKNSFGGYTGEAPYTGILAVMPKKSIFAVVGDISTEQYNMYAVHKVCADKGLNF